ncbi:Uncharacterised protein [Serratia proteamaculans]|uniref:YfjI family protein n=1 Tax=Serratia proteamaculans TaxID=28151 RepID=UPI0021833F18|nr:YfjI family protein [Serratia proteamaculans]CAI2534813.1 Uncharacterised protein [Serratia proteamaculans]
MNLSPQIYNQGSIPPARPYSPIQNQLPPYPVEHFPSVLRNVIRALQDSTQIPVELIGNVVLAATSLACQSLIEVIQPHTNMPEPCSLYLMTIAESGEGKTTINKQVMKPFYAFASELKQEYEKRLIGYKREYKVWKVRQQALDSNLRQAIKKGYSGEDEELDINAHAEIEPQRPARPNFIYEDTSLKALVEGLSEHPEAGFISDEAITFFKSHLKNTPGLLNKAWDGEMFDFRRADGEIYQITPCLTFSLMSQPAVFMDYLNKHGSSARASGFLSRFLFTWGASTIGSRENAQEYIATKQDLNTFHEKIGELLALNEINIYAPCAKKKTLRLSEQALLLWKSNRTEIDRKMASGNEWEHIRDIASKANANALRMAALLQYIHNEHTEEISGDIMQHVVNIINWYLGQASQLFYPMSERYQFEQDVRELHSWIINRTRQNNGFAILKNDLEKYGPHRLRRTEKLTPVLNQLISQGYFGVIQMFSHSALYVTFHYNNGNFGLPAGFAPNTPFTIIQSRNNTSGRTNHVNISNT